MARLPAFATALAVHAAVFATLVVLPVFTPEPLPDPSGASPSLPPWPLLPRVAFADARPPGASPDAARPKRILTGATPFADEGTPPAPSFDSDGPPTEEAEAFPIGIDSFGTSPSDAGADVCCGPSAGAGDAPGGVVGGSGEGPVRIGGDVRPPTKLRHVTPRYPELALRARVGGTVEIDCLIDDPWPSS